MASRGDDGRHREARSGEAIQEPSRETLDCFAALAMTGL
jgi:hypothetical protein